MAGRASSFPNFIRRVERKPASVRHHDRGELDGRRVQRREISIQDGPNSLPLGNRLEPVYLSERHRSRRDYLAIEGIHRIEHLGLDEGACPLRSALGQINAKRYSGLNHQRGFLLLGTGIGLRLGRDDGDRKTNEEKDSDSDVHNGTFDACELHGGYSQSTGCAPSYN